MREQLTEKERLVLAMAKIEPFEPIRDFTIENGVYRALRVRGFIFRDRQGRVQLTEKGKEAV
jgi:hypothetical protein